MKIKTTYERRKNLQNEHKTNIYIYKVKGQDSFTLTKKKVYKNKENEEYLSIHILYQSIFSLFVCDEVIQMLLFVLKN